MRIFVVILLLFLPLFSNQNILKIDSKIKEIDSFLNNHNNPWIKRYNSYKTYQQVEFNIIKAQEKIESLQKEKITIDIQNQINNLQRNLDTLQKQKDILSNYKDSPFVDLTTPQDLGKAPNVTNIFLIVKALSYMKQSNETLKTLQKNYQSLLENIEYLKQKDRLLKELLEIYNKDKDDVIAFCKLNSCLFENTYKIQMQLNDTLGAFRVLEATRNVFVTTLEFLEKDIAESNELIKSQVKAQIIKGVYIGITILVLFGIALSIKLAVKKYIHDNERIYTTNKIINFLNITLIILILLFAYLDNVTYLVTVLGFASAGLAIAMKDLFMSILGWIVIVVSGAVHAGDRIKVIKDGAVYVGDVLDISILRTTLYEDITLTTYMDNRRAGRVIFIPNNFIFTTMFSNYSHSGLKSVWDGIDFTITFNSDHIKACHIARECAKKYAKGYTESTKKQFNKLRDKYTIKNTSVEPRVFSFLEPNGIRISVWYLTDAFSTLAIRSSISSEIISEIIKEPNIKIAYPSTTIYHGDALKDSKQITDGIIPNI